MGFGKSCGANVSTTFPVHASSDNETPIKEIDRINFNSELLRLVNVYQSFDFAVSWMTSKWDASTMIAKNSVANPKPFIEQLVCFSEDNNPNLFQRS